MIPDKNCISGVNATGLDSWHEGHYKVGEEIWISDTSFAHKPGMYFSEDMSHAEKKKLGVDCVTIEKMLKKHKATVVHAPYIDSFEMFGDENFYWFIDVQTEDGTIWSVIGHDCAHYYSLEDLERSWKLDEELFDDYMDFDW